MITNPKEAKCKKNFIDMVQLNSNILVISMHEWSKFSNYKIDQANRTLKIQAYVPYKIDLENINMLWLTRKIK